LLIFQSPISVARAAKIQEEADGPAPSRKRDSYSKMFPAGGGGFVAGRGRLCMSSVVKVVTPGDASWFLPIFISHMNNSD
jgi:hypothetical protein